MIVMGAFGSALISATIGVSVLYATHVEGYSGLGPAWLIYWLGDATGGLLVTPLILTAVGLSKVRGWDRVTEFVTLQLLLTLSQSGPGNVPAALFPWSGYKCWNGQKV